ncbi:MAG: Mitotic exit network component [Bogoriella megaspora]|nr:MAG: Mitotic exit network component [Bogoriella megaspora]
MFVSRPSPQWLPYNSTPKQSTQPLPPICTESNSCVRLDALGSSPTSPKSAYKSPLQRVFEGVLGTPPSPFSPSTKTRTRGDSDVSALSIGSSGSGGVSLFGYAFGVSRAHDFNPSFLHTKPDLNEGLHRILEHSNSRSRNAFKPQKASRGTSSWQLKQFAEATLGSGSLRKAVKLPEGEDKDEWLAVNVVDFYNQINLLYGSITEFCSPQTCPEMKATDEFEYLWQDNENYKRPTKMPAPEYIEHLMSWIQSNVDNEQVFPSRIGVPFPKSFNSTIRQIFKRLYRVYAHVYCHHYPVVIHLGLEPHLNTSFKHYVLFVDEHGLSGGAKDFWGPLGDLVESMLKSD